MVINHIDIRIQKEKVAIMWYQIFPAALTSVRPQDFACLIPIRIEVFVASGVFALIIAGLTVSDWSIKAANPVDSLRYE